MPTFGDAESLTIGIAQIAPVWLNRNRTLEKIIEHVTTAANQECQLVVFGEALLPGYPFWIEHTDGARFNSPLQKEIHAHYLQNAVQIEAGHLSRLCEACFPTPLSNFMRMRVPRWSLATVSRRTSQMERAGGK